MNLRIRIIQVVAILLTTLVFLYPRWYVDYGGGVRPPQRGDSQRAFLFTGPKNVRKPVRLAQTQGQLTMAVTAKVRGARVDWRRATQEGAVIFFVAFSVIWFLRRRERKTGVMDYKPNQTKSR